MSSNIAQQLVRNAFLPIIERAKANGRPVPEMMHKYSECLILKGIETCFTYLTEGIASLPDAQAERAMEQLAKDLEEYARNLGKDL